jgi:hypothetical protein
MLDESKLVTDRILTDVEMLTYYINSFRDKRLAHVIDLHHHKAIKEEDPRFARLDQATGERVNIDQLIEINRRGIITADRNVKLCEKMLADAQGGKLDQWWSEKATLDTSLADAILRKPGALPPGK